LKDYYIDCSKCGIVSGKLYGFKLAKLRQLNHEKEHIIKNERYDYITINDWIVN
jgi:hypothetical protein